MFSRHQNREKTSKASPSDSAPKPARRSLHRKSTILSGRTIAAKRDRLETANERAAARKKDKRRSTVRFIAASFCFLGLAGALFILYSMFIKSADDATKQTVAVAASHQPTIDITDEDTGAISNSVTSRMREFVGRVEDCLKEKGYQPQKAVIPASGIREVRIYLEGYNGYIKMIVDRDPAVSAEDADRMIRYLKDNGIEEFKYIDVRVDGRAYWKEN